MNRDALFRYIDQHYIARRDILPCIPLGANLEEIWQEVCRRRRARATTLPIQTPWGSTYWFVTTDRMISASETIVEEMLSQEPGMQQSPPAISPLEEVFYTSFVEGSPMTMQAAMEFLQGNLEPGDIEEQMIANNCNAMSFAQSNLYHTMDEQYIQMLAFILTENMDGGGQANRTSDWVEIPSMMGESYTLPTALSLPDRMRELIQYLRDGTVHPLIKAGVAQAWILAARPFPEGNERLARLLSSVILIRAGYAFFGEVSISSLIAKNGYPYYSAIANTLREEHDGDLTYFLEHYLILLAQAVEELRRRRRERDTQQMKEEQELAKKTLTGTAASGSIQQAAASSSAVMSVGKMLREEGFISLSEVDTGPEEGIEMEPTETSEDTVFAGEPIAPEHESYSDGQSHTKGGDNRWSGEDRIRAALQTELNRNNPMLSTVLRVMNGFLDNGKYSFTANELRGCMNLDTEKTHTLLYLLKEKEIIEKISGSEPSIYTFLCGSLSESDYTPAMINKLNQLLSGSQSMKDKRIGTVLLQSLDKGYVTNKDYKKGDKPRWAEDMKLAEQMGFVKRITRDRYVILRDAKPCFEMLEPGQKKRAKMMYDAFGNGSFSLGMVVATLDYSSSTASAYLHQFTLLRILDCRKEDVNMYQFLVNPTEHPEIFEETA